MGTLMDNDQFNTPVKTIPGTSMTLDETLNAISTNIREAEQYGRELFLAAEEIKSAGMYPAVPSEQWQDRGGDGQYLYMIFKTDGNGIYQGPGNARKLYVGNKADRIAEARRLAENRRRYEEITATLNQLHSWLRSANFDVMRALASTIHPPRAKCYLHPMDIGAE